MKEFNLIKKYFKPLTKNSKASQGLLDDVARINLKTGEELILSKDMMVEDVHFLRMDGGYKIAAKLLLSNLSDLAASGAKPLYYMLGFSKNNQLNEEFYREFSQGLKSVQDKFNITLIGGDTVYSDKLAFSVTIFGLIKKNKILTRNQAKAGDLICVTGNIGEAFLGRSNPKEYPQDRHFFPQPRVEFANLLAENNLSKCAIDVSDGLFADLSHICKASKLTAQINLEKIPLSKKAENFLKNNKKLSIVDLSSGGDDYEIIFSCTKKNEQKILQLAKKLKLKISNIGFFKKSKNKEFTIELFDEKNKEIKLNKLGYEH